MQRIWIKMCLLLFFVSQPVMGQTTDPVTVTLSLPDTLANPGDVLEIPILISDVTDLNIVSTDMLIYYDARILTADRPVINGTLTNRWTEASRVGFVEGSQDTVGLIDIALATSNRIPSGSGIFLYVRFTVSDSAQDGQVSKLMWTEAILNNRNPQTATVDGSVTVRVGSTLVGDFDGDCDVDFQDFVALAQHFGSSQGDNRYEAIYDLNSDGQISFPDFVTFAQQFGKTC